MNTISEGGSPSIFSEVVSAAKIAVGPRSSGSSNLLMFCGVVEIKFFSDAAKYDTTRAACGWTSFADVGQGSPFPPNLAGARGPRHRNQTC
jgi:hypothetical protein